MELDLCTKIGFSTFRCAAATAVLVSFLKRLNLKVFSSAIFLCAEVNSVDRSGFARCLVKLSTVLSTDFVGSPKALSAADA